MRRSLIVLCGPYHVPLFSRVAIFPIHLDPPTLQHREIFRLLLGASSPNKELITQRRGAASGSSSPSSSSSLLPVPQGGILRKEKGHPTWSPHSSQDGSASGAPEVEEVRRITTPYWYMEPFAQSLREDSQLCPFDDLILVPNTRYPVSLRQSTHLAALAVLATRGLPRVHVDFTALEHPDESMPVVYDLVSKYRNCALVHWLHDAYEMQYWAHFAEYKMQVPILLLQTASFPPEELERQKPVQTRLPQLTSRQYHPPERLHSAHEQEVEYYTRAKAYMKDLTAHRRAHQQLRDAFQKNHTREQQGHRRREEEEEAGGNDDDDKEEALDYRLERHQNTIGNENGVTLYHSTIDARNHSTTPVPSSSKNMQRQFRKGRGSTRFSQGSKKSSAGVGGAPLQDVPEHIQLESVSEDPSAASATASESSRKQLSSQGLADEVLDFSECVKGTWWNTPGGRGDDTVEVSRSYMNSASSSWLGGDASPSWLPETEGENSATMGGGVDARGICLSAMQQDGFHPLRSSSSVSRKKRTSVADTIIGEEKQCIPSGDGTLPASTAGGAEGGASQQEQREKANADARERLLWKEIDDVRHNLEQLMEPSLDDEEASAAIGAHNHANPKAPSSHPFATRSPEEHFLVRQRRRSRNVRQLIEELYPARGFEPVSGGPAPPSHHYHYPAANDHHPRGTRVVSEEEEFDFSPAPTAAVSTKEMAAAVANANTSAVTTGHPRALSSAKIVSTGNGRGHFCFPLSSVADAKQEDPRRGESEERAGGCDVKKNTAGHTSEQSGTTAAAAMATNTHHNCHCWSDAPLVEVHPVVRSTGADVRQALWEQAIHPSSILTDCVQRYVDSHALYRDSRKAVAALSGGGLSGGMSGGYRRGGADGAGSLGAAGGGGVGGGSSSSGAGSVRDLTSASGASSGYGAAGSGGRIPPPRDTSTLCFPGLIPRLELHYDRGNLLAREQYEKLRVFECQDGDEPDLIVPIGGDGYMMHCIRKNWRRFIPFYGVNAGHVGYLLNDRSTLEELFSSPLKLHFTTMLYCQAEKESETGERVLLSELAFNDAWVERSSGQTALIRILVNGQERIRRLRGDGVLVSTAAGSTAYSQALGASPVPVGAPLIQIVGSNVVAPAQWRPAHLDQEDQVEFEVIDSAKRPCCCFVDSVDVGNVTRMLVRSSRVAGVTLAFSKSCDLQHKLYQMQFPKSL